MENQKLNEIDKTIKEKQISAIKDIVQLTLEQIHHLEKEKNDIQEKIKILKRDLYDMKDGRLDRIVERQALNGKCEKISVILVKKREDINKIKNPWYVDYDITYKFKNTNISIVFNNSLCKLHSSGSYKLKDGVIKYL